MLINTRTDTSPRPEASAGEVAWLLVGGLGLVGFWMDGLGPILPLLQHDLHVTRGTVAFYPSAFALGLIVFGIAAPRLTGPGRRHAAFTLSVLALGGGACLIAAGIAPVVCLIGALVMGAGAALVVGLAPALGTDVHGSGAAGLLSQANALSSGAGLLAPLLIAAALALGLGWGTGYLLVPLLGAGVVLVLLARARLPDAAPPPASSEAIEDGASDPETWRLWVSLVLAVSVEFCVVFWAPSYLHSNLGLRTATASALAGVFLLGMATGRASVGLITRRLGAGDETMFVIIAVAVAGFTMFWLADVAWLATVGLAVIGLGVALMYPLTVARYVAAAPAGSTRASARAGLGSGIAIGISPFVLAMISGATGLHAAYLLVPVLCVALVINTRIIHRHQQTRARSLGEVI